MGKAARKHREGFVMTETKYIFPKQPQSVTVLVFITVLIVLLLILTVMVHMRNRTKPSTAGISCRCNYDMDSKRNGEKLVQIFVDADAVDYKLIRCSWNVI